VVELVSTHRGPGKQGCQGKDQLCHYHLVVREYSGLPGAPQTVEQGAQGHPVRGVIAFDQGRPVVGCVEQVGHRIDRQVREITAGNRRRDPRTQGSSRVPLVDLTDRLRAEHGRAIDQQDAPPSRVAHGVEECIAGCRQDVDAEYERLVATGLPVAQELRSEPFGQRHFISQDPNGVLIDIITLIEPSPEYAAMFAETPAS
jgi:hypothetical protein